MNELKSVWQAATRFDIQIHTIYRWLKKGKLENKAEPGQNKLVAVEDVAVLVAELKRESAERDQGKARIQKRNEPPSGTVSIHDAAQKSGIGEDTIRGWIRGGELETTGKGSRKYVKLPDIWAIFEKGDSRFLKLLSRAGIGLVKPEWAKEKNDESV